MFHLEEKGEDRYEQILDIFPILEGRTKISEEADLGLYDWKLIFLTDDPLSEGGGGSSNICEWWNGLPCEAGQWVTSFRFMWKPCDHLPVCGVVGVESCMS